MFVSNLIMPILAFAAQATAPPIVVVGHAWAPFISPMGEPFRARSTSDYTLGMWFRQADRDGNGFLTSAEMLADADRFFARLDLNDDHEIDPEEIVEYEWEVAPEIQVNSRWRRAPGDVAPKPARPERDKVQSFHREEPVPSGWHGGGKHDFLEGAARYALLNIPEPVAAADANLDRGVSLGEFRKAAAQRFNLLDAARSGSVNLAQLEALKRSLPTPGDRSKRKDAFDTRIGTPLPSGD